MFYDILLIKGTMESSLVKMGFPGRDLNAENGTGLDSAATDHAPVFCLWYVVRLII